MKRKTLSLAVVAVLALGATSVYAVGPRGECGAEQRMMRRGESGAEQRMMRRGEQRAERGQMRRDGMMQVRMVEKLDRTVQLTPEQRETITQLLTVTRTDTQENRGKMRTLRREMRELVQQNADEAVLRAKAEEIGALVANMTYEGTRLRQAIRNQLSPEQQAKADEMSERRGQGRRGRGRRVEAVEE